LTQNEVLIKIIIFTNFSRCRRSVSQHLPWPWTKARSTGFPRLHFDKTCRHLCPLQHTVNSFRKYSQILHRKL